MPSPANTAARSRPMTTLATATLVATALLFGCGQNPNASTASSPTGKDAPAALPAPSGPVFVLLKTDRGDVALQLDPAKAPISVGNFMGYVRSGFYDGTVFHRCTPGFIVQGGGYDAKLAEKPTKAPIKNEWTNGLKNARGTVSMARGTAPDSATSQFFVNLADNGTLDGTNGDAGSAVFGRVVRGMDVLEKIAAIPTADKPATNSSGGATVLRGVPTQTVTIISAKEVTAAEATGPATAGSNFSIERK
jgi:peptidyl-prolyl cis-trans isomerase A (cyclophilin A)